MTDNSHNKVVDNLKTIQSNGSDNSHNKVVDNLKTIQSNGSVVKTKISNLTGVKQIESLSKRPLQKFAKSKFKISTTQIDQLNLNDLKNQKAKHEQDQQNQLLKDEQLLVAKIRDYDNQTTRLNASKLRNQILTTELRESKMKIRKLTDSLKQRKLQYHDDLIGLNQKLNQQLKDSAIQMASLSETLSELNIEYEKINEKNANYLQQLEEKESLIETLCKEKSSIEEELKQICGDFLFGCRGLKKSEFMAILDVLQTEKETLLLRNKTLENRLNQKRSKVHEVREQLTIERTKVKQLDYELKNCQNTLQQLNERNKRTQRIRDYCDKKALQLPLTNSSHSFQSVISFTSINRNSNLSLESTEHFQLNYQLEDLNNKLEIANEKLFYLEETLQELNKEKTDDFEWFYGMMQNSREYLLECLMNRNEGKSSNKS